jgi:hypothetical protein
MAKIRNLLIDTSEMPSTVVSRRLIVNGSIGASFVLQIINNPTSSSAMTKYYNFTSNSFTAGHSGANNNLVVTMSNKRYIKDVVFPSGGGSYIIKLAASEGTEISGSNNKIIISKTIEKQDANATLTFQPASLDNPLNYADLTTASTTSTSTGALTDTGSVSFDWTITNTSTDDTPKGFGFIVGSSTQTLNHKALYVKATTTVVSQEADTKAVTVNSLTGFAVGSYLWSGTGLSGTPRIMAIDTENKILTLSSAQDINDGVELTVKSYGTSAIQAVIGVTVDFTPVSGGIGNSPRFIKTALTKTVRGTVSSSTDVTLTDTLGIAGGNVVTYTGVGVDNSSSNRVVSVTEDYDGTDENGKVVVELAQTLSEGTELRFEGSVKTVRILGGISINGYPSTDQTIYFDLDEALSVGEAT